MAKTSDIDPVAALAGGEPPAIRIRNPPLRVVRDAREDCDIRALFREVFSHSRGIRRYTGRLRRIVDADHKHSLACDASLPHEPVPAE